MVGCLFASSLSFCFSKNAPRIFGLRTKQGKHQKRTPRTDLMKIVDFRPELQRRKMTKTENTEDRPREYVIFFNYLFTGFVHVFRCFPKGPLSTEISRASRFLQKGSVLKFRRRINQGKRNKNNTEDRPGVQNPRSTPTVARLFLILVGAKISRASSQFAKSATLLANARFISIDFPSHFPHFPHFRHSSTQKSRKIRGWALI